jgi:hypothetical protein
MKKPQLFMTICLLGLIGLIVLNGCNVGNTFFIRSTETPVPTATSTPIPTPAATKTPLPTATLVATATLVPTVTPMKLSSDSTAPIRVSDGTICYHWSTITTADAGKFKCVYGFVQASWYNQDSHYDYLIFSSETSAFYFRAFYQYLDESSIYERCVFSEGIVDIAGNAPTIDVYDEIYLCN